MTGGAPAVAINSPTAAAPQRLPAMPIPQRSPIAAALARLATRLLAAQAPAADGSVPADFLALARQVSAAADAPSAAERLPNLELATRLFGLSQDEEDLLLLASLVEVDPGAARLVALLNDHAGRTRPTLGVVRDLGGRLDAVIERLLGGGPLLRLGLVSLEGDGPWSTRCVKVDAAVWPLLLGLQRTPPFTLQAGEAPAADLQALPEEVVSACARAAGSLTPRSASSVLLAVAGDDGVGRLSMARSIAAAWRPQAIVIDAAAIAGPETIAALARETLWSHAVLIVTHAEDLAPTLWRALNDRVDAPLVVTAQQRGLGALALHSARPLVEVRAPRRDAKQRLRLWRARAPGAWPAEALRDLAERFDFGHDQIGTALGLAAARRTAAGAADAVPEIDDVRRACETLRETRFAGTAERIDCPHDPEDIVLRPETRRELDLALAWARHGAQVFAADGAGAA
ncbi:MAG TPA: hypothetical protein VLJ62_05790, partial [Burkholderiaceae bacterium]|nr:hypothetical protein [Burkholderiaceae bacterium]